MEAISQIFCSLQEEMGLQSIYNQCFHNISASFFFKILFVSFTLLYTFKIGRDRNGVVLPSKCVLYYDPTVVCHLQKFTIFASLAVCVLLTFIICPTTLLILYPTKLLRKCVPCCGFRRWHALHMFMESFQGTVQRWNQWYS